MDTAEKIKAFLDSLSVPKCAEMQALHTHILQLFPKAKLWFLDGKDETGKVVTNPSIGYGQYTIHYKDGSTKEFYQIGISSNSTGISVYVMGLEDKKYLPETFGNRIGKASVTGYCIKFKTVKDIKLDILDEAMCYGIKHTDND
jgi:hypothetical protein